MGAEYIQLIWVPDTFFVNEKTAYFHSATTENQFLRILHTGEILRSIRWVISEKSQAYNKCNEKEAAAVYLWGQKPTSIDSSKLVGDNQHYFAKERESEIGISQGHFHTLFLRALAMITTFCKGHLLLKKPPTYVLYAYIQESSLNFGRTSWKPPQEMRMFFFYIQVLEYSKKSNRYEIYSIYFEILRELYRRIAIWMIYWLYVLELKNLMLIN